MLVLLYSQNEERNKRVNLRKAVSGNKEVEGRKGLAILHALLMWTQEINCREELLRLAERDKRTNPFYATNYIHEHYSCGYKKTTG